MLPWFSCLFCFVLYLVCVPVGSRPPNMLLFFNKHISTKTGIMCVMSHCLHPLHDE
jgi:hypothetical protein